MEKKDGVTGGKRKAEDSVALDVGGEAVPLPGERVVDEATGITYVDMPESYLGWVLSQKRMSTSTYDPRGWSMLSPEEIERELKAIEFLKKSLEGVDDEFFEFQAWVRETYETKGRVLVPEESIPLVFTSKSED